MLRMSLLTSLAVLPLFTLAHAQEPMGGQLKEPLLRVARSTPNANQPQHALDPALDLAKRSLVSFRQNIADYTCTLVKRERIKGKLGDSQFMFAKVRNRKVENGRIVTPFSVYLYFLKPDKTKGREVIFVEGQNNGKMIAHEGGAAGRFLPAVWLRPTGTMAMRGQLYPITDLGVDNLLVKLLERGQRDRAIGPCTVNFRKNAKIENRPCTILEVVHPQPSPKYDFHKAQIFIDNQLGFPVRYAAYSWPTAAGQPLPVLEEYTYLNVKVNVGLTDKDFDPSNKDYNFGK